MVSVCLFKDLDCGGFGWLGIWMVGGLVGWGFDTLGIYMFRDFVVREIG